MTSALPNIQPAQSLADLRGQVAIVTGASSGIGAATAELLLQQGMRVVLAARRVERLKALAERYTGKPGEGEALSVECDVREPEQVQRLIKTTLDHWGQLDVLIANAGFGYRKQLVESDPQVWKDMIDTNVYGLLLTLKYGVAPMLERKRGHVIVMSSVAGVVATPGGSAYCGTKAAAAFIADSLRMEVGPQGIAVTSVEPGVVISEFQEVAGYAPEIVPNMLKGAAPLVPGDIARVILYAIQQPANVGVSEILIRPRGQANP